MDFNGIIDIIDKINSTDIAYFEYKTNDGQLKLDKSLMRNIPSVNIQTEDRVYEVDKEVKKKNNDTIVEVASKINHVTTPIEEDEDIY